MSLSRVESVDRRRSNARADVAGELQADARSAVKLDLVVADDIAEHVRDAIASSTLGAGRGAGQILISRIDEVVELGANNPKNP
jgi:nitrogen regulatory protein PII